MNKNRLKYTELGLKQTIMNTASTVEQAYYDLIAARENVRAHLEKLKADGIAFADVHRWRL